MNVLFLAVGGGRQRAAVEESASVVAAGGTATVVVSTLRQWQFTEFAPGVAVLDSALLHRVQLPWRIERLVVFRGPGFLLKRSLGGAAARWYEKKVAERFHRRVFLPVHRRLRPDVRSQLLAQHIARSPRPYDWIVVTDSRSMPEAVKVLDFLPADAPRAGLTFSVDHIATAHPNPRRELP